VDILGEQKGKSNTHVRMGSMFRKLLAAVGAAILAAGPGLAWTRAGHMVMGAIAFDDLQRSAPPAVARVVAILREHPQYESRWKPQLLGMSEEDQARFLFMLAARWPDDIRGDNAFDHPLWHYINYPYRPPGQPASLPGPDPAAEDIITAFQRNVTVVKSAAADPEKAVAWCWIFHLIGDAHQPLHAAALVTTQFPMGDQGGNLFYIRPDPTNSATRNLHSYWDGVVLTDEHYEATRARAIALEGAHRRRSLGELREPRFETWLKKESFDLAVSTTYRHGKLQAGADRDHGIPVPGDYAAKVRRVAERRVALSGYRMADLLRNTLP
jgi:S1/P1 Nuclease